MSGPRRNEFGDLVSSSLNLSRPQSGHTDQFNNNRIVRGQITAVYNVDDRSNSELGPGPAYTLYDVLVTHPGGHTELLTRCRMMQPASGGSINNFHEVVTPSPGRQAKDFRVSSDLKRGTIVMVAYVEGHKSVAVILGALPHPSSVAQKRRSKRSAGARLEGEFQGLNYAIDNDGSLTVTFNGPRDDKGEPLTQSGPTTLRIDRDGNVSASNNADQVWSMDRTTRTTSMRNGTTVITTDQGSSTVTVEADNVKVNARRRAEVNSQGTAAVTARGPLSIVSAAFISLGKGEGSAGEPFVLGNVFTSMMTRLLTAIATHMHIGNLAAPTTPPVNAAEFVALQTSPVGDKKILSDLVKGEK